MGNQGLLLPENTLAHQLSRPFFKKGGIANISVGSMSKRIRDVESKHNFGPLKNGNKLPEQTALNFYGMNHGVAMIMQRYSKHDTLPEAEFRFVKSYVDYWSIEGVRAFYYLMLIITREFRHGNTNSGLQANFGAEMAQWWKTHKAGGEAKIKQGFYTNPPGITLEHYVSAIEWAFYNHSFGSGYGGPPWGMIANCTKCFVTGEYSMEMMLDTIWTLSHNNGPIFNKGMLYSMYNKPALMKILDVQRSGQIPQLVLDCQPGSSTHSNMSSYISKGLRNNMSWLVKEYDMTETVDWHMVEKLGALGQYTGAASSPSGKAAKKPQTTPKKTFDGATSKGMTHKDGTYTGKSKFILPTLTVQEIKLKRA